MAKRQVLVSGTSIDDIINEVQIVAEFAPDVITQCMLARVRVGEDAARTNWTSMVGWGKTGDLVYDSISSVAKIGSVNPEIVYGSYGVYSVDSIAVKHGKTNKDLTAAQLSWWVEFGTKTMPPIAYLTNAHIRTIDAQETAFKETFNKLIDGRLNNG